MNEKMATLDAALREALYAHAEGLSPGEVAGVLSCVQWAVMSAGTASKEIVEGYT